MTRSRGVQRFSLARLVWFRSTLVPKFFGRLSDNFHAFWPSEDLFFWHAGKKQKNAADRQPVIKTEEACMSGYFGDVEKERHLQRVISVIAECCFFSATVWSWWHLSTPVFDPDAWCFYSYLTTKWTHLVLRVKQWNMKSSWPFIWKADKRDSGECRLNSHEEAIGSFACWSEKAQQQQQQHQLGSKMCFSTAGVMSEERGGLCHLVDKLKHWTYRMGNHSGEQIKNRIWFQRISKCGKLATRSQTRVIHTVVLSPFAFQLNDKLNRFSSISPTARYVYLDIESTIPQLNFDKRVRCLLVTLRHSAGSRKAQCKVP